MTGRTHFRAYPRSRVEISAALVARHAAELHPVRVRDVALGGVCIEIGSADALPEPLVVDAVVTIELNAPTLWDPLRLAGRVRWIRRARTGASLRAGIRFDHTEAASLYTLSRLVTPRSEE